MENAPLETVPFYIIYLLTQEDSCVIPQPCSAPFSQLLTEHSNQSCLTTGDTQ